MIAIIKTNQGNVRARITILKKLEMLKLKLDEPIEGTDIIIYNPITGGSTGTGHFDFSITRISEKEIEQLVDAGFEEFVERSGFKD